MITLTEKELRTIIRESLLKVLDEAISDREFHYTMLSNLCKMMETNNLHMSSAEEGNPLGDKFMSLTRNRSNQQGFQYGTFTNTEYKSKQNYARIEFNGRALQNLRGVKIKPFDYLYGQPSYDNDRMNGKQMHQGDTYGMYGKQDPYGQYRQFYSQAEDRMFSNTDNISGAFNCITVIDVMIRDKSLPDVTAFYDTLEKYPQWKSKIKVHTDNNTFNKPMANNSQLKGINQIGNVGI